MRKTLAAALLATAMAASSANALTYYFSFADPTDSGHGYFIAGPGGFPKALSGIAGVFDGDAITGLSSYAGADNILYGPSAPHESFAGVSFTTDVGAFNLYTWNGVEMLLKSSVDATGYPQNGLPLTIVPNGNPTTGHGVLLGVPEPATWAMMILGVFGIGALARRRAALGVAAA